jgi:hypothetical protein
VLINPLPTTKRGNRNSRVWSFRVRDRGRMTRSGGILAWRRYSSAMLVCVPVQAAPPASSSRSSIPQHIRLPPVVVFHPGKLVCGLNMALGAVNYAPGVPQAGVTRLGQLAQYPFGFLRAVPAACCWRKVRHRSCSVSDSAEAAEVGLIGPGPPGGGWRHHGCGTRIRAYPALLSARGGPVGGGSQRRPGAGTPFSRVKPRACSSRCRLKAHARRRTETAA